MRLNSALPLSDRLNARLCAQAYISNSFDIRKTVQELRPDLAPGSTWGAKMLEEPMVQREINFIINRLDRNAETFLAKMWKWLDDESDNKLANERRMTAARILAKGYVREKEKGEKQSKPFIIDGLESINNLVESPKKVQ